MIGLLHKSVDRLKVHITDRNYDMLSYDLLKKNYSREFLDKNRARIKSKLDDIGKRSTKSLKTFLNAKIHSPQAAVNNLWSPSLSNIGSILWYIGLNKENLRSVVPWKIPAETPDGDLPRQVISDVLERLVYNEMKPYNLLSVYNDDSNKQNFNHNLTFHVMDVDNPCEWFPNARKLKRKFIMHVGPTNSGKTYHALKRLERCTKGYYAGPLRLLAREVYDKFQKKNINCNLVTGEEVLIDIDGNGNKAGITSGTIEMLSMSESYDVVVVDEIQMIGDQYRGSAWTNAVLGVRAKEIHLCGEISAVPIIKRLVAMTGDDLEIKTYKRLGKLVVDDSIVEMTDLSKGDCIVCFSKTAILDMKIQIERQTNFKCAVIYGALPPETRSQEAQRFNDGIYDIVVASDAIGMGLNLKINRVIFTTTQKFNGSKNVSLTSSNIKQIGGRAGRYGIGGESVGHITAISRDELENVSKGVEGDIKYINKAILWPPDDLWIKYYSMFAPETNLVTIYRRFEEDLNIKNAKTAERSEDFKVQSLKDKLMMSGFFKTEKLLRGFLIQDQLRCISAPTTLSTNPNQPMKLVLDYVLKEFMVNIIQRTRKSLFDFTAIPLYLLSTENVKRTGIMRGHRYSIRGSSMIEPEPVPAALRSRASRESAKFAMERYQPRRRYVKRLNPVEDRLTKLEQFHKMLSSYMWLAYRFPQNFIDLESARSLKEVSEFKISEMLGSLRAVSGGSKRFKTFLKH